MSAPVMADDVLTVREASQFLKVPERSLRQYIAEGRIPAVRIGRHMRLSRRELEAVLAGGERR